MLARLIVRYDYMKSYGIVLPYLHKPYMLFLPPQPPAGNTEELTTTRPFIIQDWTAEGNSQSVLSSASDLLQQSGSCTLKLDQERFNVSVRIPIYLIHNFIAQLPKSLRHAFRRIPIQERHPDVGSQERDMRDHVKDMSAFKWL